MEPRNRTPRCAWDDHQIHHLDHRLDHIEFALLRILDAVDKDTSIPVAGVIQQMRENAARVQAAITDATPQVP